MLGPIRVVLENVSEGGRIGGGEVRGRGGEGRDRGGRGERMGKEGKRRQHTKTQLV